MITDVSFYVCADDVAAAAVVNVVVETAALFDAVDIVVHDVLAADTVVCAVDIAVVETVAGVELLGHLICAHRFAQTLPIGNLEHFFPLFKLHSFITHLKSERLKYLINTYVIGKQVS